MLEYLVFVAAAGSLAAALVYIRSMFKGRTRPSRVTWFLWALAPLVAAAASVSDGVGWAVIPVFMSGFSPLLIFLASFFNKKAYWQFSLFDLFCGVLSGLALVFWFLTSEPNLAIALAIASDAFAAVPTISKSWGHPETESIWPYLIGVLSPMASFFAATTWQFSEIAFPTYLIMVNFVILVLIVSRR